MGKVLVVLGKVLKGKGTPIGVIVSALGLGGTAATGNMDKVAKCMETLINSPDSLALVAGLSITLFSIGRKAGWIAAENGEK